jgi:hypothetical protein
LAGLVLAELEEPDALEDVEEEEEQPARAIAPALIMPVIRRSL